MITGHPSGLIATVAEEQGVLRRMATLVARGAGPETEAVEGGHRRLAAGIGTELVKTGNLKAFRERDTAHAEWSAAWRLAELGLVGEPGELLDWRGLHELEPRLGDAARWGFLRTDVRWGDPSVFVDQMSAYLAERGVALVDGFAAERITELTSSVMVASKATSASSTSP